MADAQPEQQPPIEIIDNQPPPQQPPQPTLGQRFWGMHDALTQNVTGQIRNLGSYANKQQSDYLKNRSKTTAYLQGLALGSKDERLKYVRNFNTRFGDREEDNQNAVYPKINSVTPAKFVKNYSDKQLNNFPQELSNTIQQNDTARNEVFILYLNNNKITQLPESIRRLNNLLTLDLTNNKLTSLPDSLHNLPHLLMLILTENNLTSLPQTLSLCPWLTTLDVTNNDLNSFPQPMTPGPYDEENPYFNRLETLILDKNEFSEFPIQVMSAPKLNYLSLGHNQIRELPDTFPSQPAPTTETTSLNYDKKLSIMGLAYLYLDNNYLTSLPRSMEGLQCLITLDLNNNQFRTPPLFMVKNNKWLSMFLLDNEINPQLVGAPSPVEPYKSAVNLFIENTHIDLEDEANNVKYITEENVKQLHINKEAYNNPENFIIMNKRWRLTPDQAGLIAYYASLGNKTLTSLNAYRRKQLKYLYGTIIDKIMDTKAFIPFKLGYNAFKSDLAVTDVFNKNGEYHHTIRGNIGEEAPLMSPEGLVYHANPYATKELEKYPDLYEHELLPYYSSIKSKKPSLKSMLKPEYKLGPTKNVGDIFYKYFKFLNPIFSAIIDKDYIQPRIIGRKQPQEHTTNIDMFKFLRDLDSPYRSTNNYLTYALSRGNKYAIPPYEKMKYFYYPIKLFVCTSGTFIYRQQDYQRLYNQIDQMNANSFMATKALFPAMGPTESMFSDANKKDPTFLKQMASEGYKDLSYGNVRQPTQRVQLPPPPPPSNLSKEDQELLDVYAPNPVKQSVPTSFETVRAKPDIGAHIMSYLQEPKMEGGRRHRRRKTMKRRRHHKHGGRRCTRCRKRM